MQLGVSERTLFDREHERKIPPAKSLNDVSKFLCILIKE